MAYNTVSIKAKLCLLPADNGRRVLVIWCGNRAQRLAEVRVDFFS